MTVVTKADLSRELGISKARVSQYIKQGLATLPNGRLDRERSIKWIADNHHNRGPEETAGVHRAAEIARTLKVKPPIRQEPETARDVLVELAVLVLERVGPIAARLAVDFNLSMATAFALDQEIAARLSYPIEEFLRLNGRAFDDSYSILEELPPENDAHWQALADLAGVPFDIESWSEQVAAMGV